MYEIQDYNTILTRILKRFPENEDIRPSSPLYIATGPAAKEFEVQYGELDFILEQIFPNTATREFLIKHAATYNIVPYEATQAIVEGEFNIPVDIGTRFTKDGIGFVVTEEIDEPSIEYCYYRLQCEETGTKGNVTSGEIIPDYYIPDLAHALITRILIPGEEVETTEDFRERFLASFTSKAYALNLADCLQKATSYAGVGRAKVLRCVNPEGEVDPEWMTIVIMDSEYHKPSETLIADVQDYFQPVGVEGYPDLATSGLGVAAIGQLVYVRGVNEETVDIGLHLTYETGYDWETLKDSINEAIADFLEEQASEWGDITANNRAKTPYDNYVIISRAQIESMLLDIDGILDANDTKINGEFKNYSLAWDAIPVLGEVTEHSDIEIGEGVNTCSFNCPDCPYQRDPSVCDRIQEYVHG